MKDELAFNGSDPGAVKHGNFINYYSFHSTKERIDSLNASMFPTTSHAPILCLDIGCNIGELTKELYTYLKTNIYPECDIYFLAIDIDPILIKRAQENNNNNNTNIIFKHVDIMTADKGCLEKYLKLYKKENFDITFCFSVTMWIHINNGDEGLKEFLEFTKKISNTILLEPQPWKCYRNAQRRMKKSGNSFPLYDKLKIKSNVNCFIEEYLSKDSHKKVYESPASSWDRIIQSYQRIHCNYT